MGFDSGSQAVLGCVAQRMQIAIAGLKSLGAGCQKVFLPILQQLMRQMIVNSSVQLTFFTDLVNNLTAALAFLC